MLPRRGRGLGPGGMAGKQGRREMDRYAQKQAITRKRAGIWTVSNMLLIESSGKTTKIEGRARRYQSRLYMWIPRAVESSWNPHRLSTLGSSYIARNRERHIGHMRVSYVGALSRQLTACPITVMELERALNCLEESLLVRKRSRDLS